MLVPAALDLIHGVDFDVSLSQSRRNSQPQNADSHMEGRSSSSGSGIIKKKGLSPRHLGAHWDASDELRGGLEADIRAGAGLTSLSVRCLSSYLNFSASSSDMQAGTGSPGKVSRREPQGLIRAPLPISPIRKTNDPKGKRSERKMIRRHNDSKTQRLTSTGRERRSQDLTGEALAVRLAAMKRFRSEERPRRLAQTGSE